MQHVFLDGSSERAFAVKAAPGRSTAACVVLCNLKKYYSPAYPAYATGQALSQRPQGGLSGAATHFYMFKANCVCV